MDTSSVKVLYIKPQGSHYAIWASVSGEKFAFTVLASAVEKYRDRASLEAWIKKKALLLKENPHVA